MVRFTELSAARRGARRKLAAANQGATRTSILATVIGIDPEDGSRLLVSVDPADPDLSVLAGPTKVVPGALVHVEVDSAGRPIRVLGPASTRPEGLDEGVPAPAPVTPMPTLAPDEITAEERQAILDTADGLAEAQQDLADAEGLLDAIGASDGPEGVAGALTDYLAIPLDQITVVDNRGADGQVVAHLYDSIIVDGLLTASEIITGSMLADGAVTARTLNVVPEEGTGGMELQPEGLRIIPAEAGEGTAISLRSDEENWISFAQAGQSTFSVSPAGELVAQQVAANDSLEYRGLELSDVLAEYPRGLIGRAMLDKNLTSDGAWCLLGEITFTPEAGRSYTAYLAYSVGSTAINNIGAQVAVQFAGDGSSFKRSWGIPPWLVDPLRPSAGTFVYEFERGDTNIQSDGTVTLKFFGRSVVSGRQVAFHGWNQYSVDKTTACGVSVYDTGRRSALQMQSGNQPPLIGSGGTTPPPSGGGAAKKTVKGKWTSTGHRTYSYTGLTHVRAGQSLVQGANSGTNSRGHWFFDDSAIRSALSGAELESGSITIRNQHTWAGSGMTAVLKVHNYSTAPSTFGTATAWTTVHVPKGKAVNVKFPIWIMTGLKNGTIRGFSLDHGGGTSGEFYGFFSPEATIYVTYTK